MASATSKESADAQRRAFLGEHTVNRFGDERLAVVDRDDDANERR